MKSVNLGVLPLQLVYAILQVVYLDVHGIDFCLNPLLNVLWNASSKPLLKPLEVYPAQSRIRRPSLHLVLTYGIKGVLQLLKLPKLLLSPDLLLLRKRGHRLHYLLGLV